MENKFVLDIYNFLKNKAAIIFLLITITIACVIGLVVLANVELMDISIFIMCGSILASLYQQDKKFRPLVERVKELEKFEKLVETPGELQTYRDNVFSDMKENTDNINILIDRYNSNYKNLGGMVFDNIS